jgi:hypothetical protein
MPRLPALPWLLFCCLGSFAHADSWPGAVPAGVSSPDGKTLVRVLPGSNIGAVFGFAGAKGGPNGQAVYYRLGSDDKFARYQAIELLNPVAPIFFAVSNAGELVTFDNWHNMGHGKVIVVYGANGKVLRSYELAEIYSPQEVERFQQSVSSRWWRCDPSPVVGPGASSVRFHDKLGNVVEVSFRSGVVNKPAAHKGCP